MTEIRWSGSWQPAATMDGMTTRTLLDEELPDDGLPRLSDPELHRLREVVERARDGFLDTAQRWRDALSLERSFAEQYVQGRLTVLCLLERDGDRYRRRYAALRPGRGPSHDGQAAILRARREASPSYHAHKRHNEVVAIRDGELVQVDDGVVASRVWTYRLRDGLCDRRCPRSMYRSQASHLFKTMPAPPDGEPDISLWYRPGGDDLVAGEVERGPEVLQGIADDERQAARQDERRERDPVPPLLVSIDDRSVQVRIGEDSLDQGFKLVEVFIGPFDL